MHSVLWGSLQLLNKLMVSILPCFNALCALGFSSTFRQADVRRRRKVSMHSVLWGSLQHDVEARSRACRQVSMHSVLWGSLQRDLWG